MTPIRLSFSSGVRVKVSEISQMDNRMVFKIRHATVKKINAKYPECDDDDETLKKGNEERKFKIRFWCC